MNQQQTAAALREERERLMSYLRDLPSLSSTPAGFADAFNIYGP